MDSIEEYKDRICELQDDIGELSTKNYGLEDKLRKAERAKEQLLRIIENLSEGYAERGKSK